MIPIMSSRWRGCTTTMQLNIKECMHSSQMFCSSLQVSKLDACVRVESGECVCEESVYEENALDYSL